MKQIMFEDGIIRLGGEEVPGILTELRIDGKVRFDEQKVDGSSGSKKTPQGWEDADIMVGLILLTDNESNCYDKLEIMSGLFLKHDAKANPQIFDVVSSQLQARGVRQVVFSRLESAENDQTDDIRVTLGFVEHNPPIVRLEAAQAKTPTPKELAQAALDKIHGGAKPDADDVITGDLE
ncbi:MAG: hypothetical protein RRY20_08870 [Bilophila sp.]